MNEQIAHYSSILSSLDWLIFSTTILVTIAAVVYGYLTIDKTKEISNKNSILEFLIMGRQLTLPLFIATLTSTWYGGILGVTQIAFEHGCYNFITQGLFCYISYFIFAFCFVKKIRRSGAITLPEMVKKIFGHKSALLSTGLIFFKALPISYAISLGIVIQLFCDISLPIAITIGVGFVVTYSLFGGLRAVVYSDFIQWILMLTGIISVVVFSISTFGGIEFLTAKLPASHFKFTGNHNLTTTLAWVFIACTTTFINPAFYQRCFAAKSDKVAIYGILFSIVIWFIIDICTTLGGMYAKAIIPNANSSQAYLTYSLQLLPNGWRGLFLASLVATILSTLDSFLLLASSTLFYDLPALFSWKNRILNFKINHTIALIISGAITILFAIRFNGNIEDVWLTFKGYFAACLLFPLIIGYVFPKVINDSQFVVSCLIGCLGFTVWKISMPTELNPFYIGNLFTIGMIIYFIIKKIITNNSFT